MKSKGQILKQFRSFLAKDRKNSHSELDYFFSSFAKKRTNLYEILDFKMSVKKWCFRIFEDCETTEARECQLGLLWADLPSLL